MGACTLIEELDRELVWIACRHHVLEVMLSDVFSAVMGASSGPDVGLFKRFRTNWPYIDKTIFHPADEELFVDMPDGLRQETACYCAEACRQRTSRKDYAELLRLCNIFLGGSSDGATIRAIGTMRGGWPRRFAH